MKKLIGPFISAIFTFALIAACEKTDEQLTMSAESHFFSVRAVLPAIEQEEDTKAYLGSFISASWTKDVDKVSVVNLTKGKILGGELVAQQSGIITSFEGSVSGAIAVGDRLAVCYPSFNVESETDFETRKVALNEQSKASKVPLVTYALFKAEQAGGDFSGLTLDFHYMLSFLKINLANLPAGDSVTRVTLRNMPSEMTLSVNSDGTGFDAATDEEKSARGKIVVEGPYVIAASGAMAVTVGIMPSASSAVRSVVVSVKGDGDYQSPLTQAQLTSDRYYNTVASQFEKVSIEGAQEYGVYDLNTGASLDQYVDFTSTVITGVENGESDFSLVNASNGQYWTLKGFSSDAQEGDLFTARMYNYGIEGFPEGPIEGARITMMDPDGDRSKLWIKAGNYLFIVRK